MKSNEGGLRVSYCHLKDKPYVKKGESVVQGQAVGIVGMTGNTEGPHLHIELRQNKKAIDPYNFDGQKYAGRFLEWVTGAKARNPKRA